MNDTKKIVKEELTKNKVIESLAEFLGVDYKDILDEDSFMDDLHMTTADFTEFIAKLEGLGVETSDLDFEEVETVSDLIETIHLSQPL